ncbi:MAG TPA: class 1 fructose-bisphosphatase [Planctomycetaceae bacterium]|jgi:fructose-1,6-bisphosphatase I|nr:class 1 fructose-bisphosphatase [Planctomycetaceae bacterium]
MQRDSFLTVQQHIQQEQQRVQPHASGEFSWLLSGITLATKVVAAQIRRAGLVDVIGSAGTTNVQGESVQKLDILANHALLSCLGSRGNVGVLASEENDEPVVTLRDPRYGKYIVIFDPLDGSSNIDVNVSVGTIFSILRRDTDETGAREPLVDVLQPGTRQIAAGYVLYGASTLFVYSTGNGVHGFTLDPLIGAYVLTHPNLKMPDSGPYYSVNEANSASFSAGYQRYLSILREGKAGRVYSSRYVGSLVADFHRTLIKGGIFLYPPTARHEEGKLRLMYEANPIAFLAEQSGGVATDGHHRILDIQPTSLHQRTPFAVGSRKESALLAEVLEHPAVA